MTFWASAPIWRGLLAASAMDCHHQLCPRHSDPLARNSSRATLWRAMAELQSAAMLADAVCSMIGKKESTAALGNIACLAACPLQACTRQSTIRSASRAPDRVVSYD
jgi:hypothetical protein